MVLNWLVKPKSLGKMYPVAPTVNVAVPKVLVRSAH